ncbi:hypothetical protein BGZ47_010815 [Haplosporangium gracile]|nr:hypothetical protein BGZ47_010815 [Haplosporangium gracile]
MGDKFEFTYFKNDKDQPKGPQARCHEWSDQNSLDFFVAIDGPSHFEYSSYKDSARFLKAYVTIRKGQACNEYYDIDWTLVQVTDESEILRLEQQVFAAFLIARNQHAPDYSLSTQYCRVLSAFKDMKVSLHIIIPTMVFENSYRDMKSFKRPFQSAWLASSDSALLKHIDMGIVDAVRTQFVQTLQASQFEMQCVADRVKIFKLQRKAPGHCEREHRRDSAYLRLAESRVLWLYCHRSSDSTGVELCKRDLDLTGFKNYQDIPPGVVACDRLVVQAESLCRLDPRLYTENTILILDEVSSLIKQMCSDKSMGNKHDLNVQFSELLNKKATRVIGLDADLCCGDVEMLKGLRSDTFQHQKGDQFVLFASKAKLTAEAQDLLRGGKWLWISSTMSATKTEAMHAMFEQASFRSECVTKNTSETKKRDIDKNIDRPRLLHSHALATGKVGRSPTLRLRFDNAKNLMIPDDLYHRMCCHVLTKKHLSMDGFRWQLIQRMVRAGCIVKSKSDQLAPDSPIIVDLKEKEAEITVALHRQNACADPISEDEFEELRSEPES